MTRVVAFSCGTPVMRTRTSFCLERKPLQECSQAVRGWFLGPKFVLFLHPRLTVGGRRVGQRLCSSAPEPGNPRRLHPATPTAGRNSIAGEEVWGRGQRAPPTTTWQPSGAPGPFQRPGQLKRSPLKGQPWPPAGGQRGGWWHRARSVPGTAGSLLTTRARLSCLPWP